MASVSYYKRLSVVTTVMTQAETYDGDGAGVKHSVTRQTGGGAPTTDTTYLLRSSVLGGRTISEYNSSGARRTSYAWAGGEVLAQRVGVDTATPELRWQHINPVTGDGKEANAAGRLTASTHLDPDMVDAGESDPATWASPDTGGGDAGGPAVEDGIAKLVSDSTDMRCLMDGILTLCSVAHKALANDAAGKCTQRDCGPRRVIYQGRETWAFYRVYGDGYQGFVPMTARYTGNGTLTPESGGSPTLGRRSRGDARDTDLTAINGGNYKEEQELGRSPGVTFINATFGPQKLGGKATGVAVPDKDPCGNLRTSLSLDYSERRQHIINNHLRRDINPGKSKYIITDTLSING